MVPVFTTRGDEPELRAVRFGAEEVLSRLYFAVRDEHWGTVPLTVRDERRTSTATGFDIDVEAETAASHPMRVRLRYVADGGELRAEFEATAGAAFRYARIGFCVLFDVGAVRGRRARSWRDGVAAALEFPMAVVTRDHRDPAAVRFHRPFDRLETLLGTGTRLCLRCAGEEFGFEDQRNWTDPSYKAFSVRPAGDWPPLALPGARFTQGLGLTVEPGDPSPPPAGAIVRIGPAVGTVPPIGLYQGRLSARSYRPPGGFHDLNADPRAVGDSDSVELPVNGAVHAADDDSVLAATAMHGVLVAQARAAHPRLPVSLGPLSFLDVPGDWRDPDGRYAPEPPAGRTLRHRTEFAATWVVASAASAVPAGPAALHYFDRSLPPSSAAAGAVARLTALEGRPVLAVDVPEPLAALAVAGPDLITLAVANTGPDRVRFRLPDGRRSELDGYASAWLVIDQRH
jgi:hypothetical protein